MLNRPKKHVKSPGQPPVAKKIPVHSEHFGIRRTDFYAWLRERENPDVRQYLEAENAYAEQALSDVSDLREQLFTEIKNRIPQEDLSAPYPANGYIYYTRFRKGSEHPAYCRKKAGSEKEEVMLDAETEAGKYAYYQVGSRDVSPDNRILAYGEDTLSRRIYTIRFKNLNSGEYLKDVLQGTTGNVAWSTDQTYVFYTRKDPETLRSFQVYRHKLGTDQSADVLIFEEDDDTFYANVYLSKSREFIVIASTSTLTSEYRVAKADNPENFKVITPRVRGMEYHIYHRDSSFYILNNGDGAKNFKISKVSVENTSRENWVDVIPHRADVFLDGVEIFARYLVLEERSGGLTRLRVIEGTDYNGGHHISFKDPAYMAYFAVNEQISTHKLRYGYTSLTTPNSVFEYDMKTRQSQLIKAQEVVGNFSSEDYISERIFIPARDGREVPVSLVYRKGFKKDGCGPLLLYGYGSYGLSLDAYFSSQRLSLLDRGFAFAIAHIRGGQELGRDWYENGKLLHKKNTFYDFIDAARYLIDAKYTSSEHLYAMGGSAGGLLMGAVINMEPDLWNGIVAQVPFVDVVNTMLDASIPLTTGEYDEWGNPSNEKYFKYILSYSPYDNIEEKEYPPMLVTTGLHDSQVQYWEPAKWVAKLRDLKTDKNDLFLVTNLDTGHGGSSGRFERFKEVALEYAFLLRQEGKAF